jgi:hypothetical protein
VQTKTPPELSPKDYFKPKNPELKQLADEWRAAKEEFDKAKDALEGLRDKLLAKAKEENHDRMLINGVRIVKTLREGAVDYKKIPQLKDIDLDQFRKKPSEVVTISLAADET